MGRLASDERLARMASRGSKSAFAVLYERHHQALYRYCRSIVREEEDARDALQNTMMRAFAALSARERDLAVRPWLFRIAHNESITILRRRRLAERETQHAEPTAPDVEQMVGQRARLAALVADLETLADRQRAALLMRELNGLSMEEIAQALGTSQGAAKQALFEARRALHEMAEGREMDCETIRRSISERDGRIMRGRKLRAHVRSCAGCRAFSDTIATRSSDLRALAPPLPMAVAATMLARLLGLGGGSGGAAVGAGVAMGGASGGGATLGAHALGSLALKALAAGAVLTAAAAGTMRLVHGTAHHPGAAHLRPAPTLIAHPSLLRESPATIDAHTNTRARERGAPALLRGVNRSGGATRHQASPRTLPATAQATPAPAARLETAAPSQTRSPAVSTEPVRQTHRQSPASAPGTHGGHTHDHHSPTTHDRAGPHAKRTAPAAGSGPPPAHSKQHVKGAQKQAQSNSGQGASRPENGKEHSARAQQGQESSQGNGHGNH